MAVALAWGILGAGGIAKAFAEGLNVSTTGARLVAVGSRDVEKARKFGEPFGVASEKCYGSYEALLADPQVQAVYIATPHPQHARWAIAAAEAGKHILCEKPAALNFADASQMIEAAREHDVFFMEAFMYRCHPQTAKIIEIIKSGRLGEVQAIQCSFAFHAGFNPESRLFNPTLGGGGILDVGCYCTSMARLIAGVARGQPFAEPDQFKAVGKLGASGIDEYTAAVMLFPGNIIASSATGVACNMDNHLRVFGTQGSMTVPSPWIPSRNGGSTTIDVHSGGQHEKIEVPSPQQIYGIEADNVAEYVAQRQSPAMSWDDTLGNMKALDRWRREIKLAYPAEHVDAIKTPAHGRPLTRRTNHNMKYGRLPGLNKDISRLVLGVDNQRIDEYPAAAALYDGWFERGGNCFDTAHLYAGGACEKALGAWINTRGVRDQVVVIGKGVHTPWNFPKFLEPQLLESLERMQTDHVDIYFMHRDNPDVPAGEWVDALNEQVSKGRIKVYGGSNWLKERIDEANQYARSKGYAPFVGVSNNFSLARMVNPVWSGCIASSEPEYRAWHERTQTAVFSWSSQARGFFTDRAAPDKLADKELVNSWYSDDNWERKRRAIELGQQLGRPAIQVALAYVLHQRFPTFALIGPRNLAEVTSSLPGLDISLTPEQVKWLNLEA